MQVNITASVTDAEGNVSTYTASVNKADAVVLSGTVNLDSLVVNAGDKVSLDPNISTTLNVSGNVVVNGRLEMLPASPDVVHEIRIVNVDESKFVGGGMEVLDTDPGIWVVGDGMLVAKGAPKTAWLRTSQPIAVGQTQITLDSAPEGWRVGDNLVITPTLPVTVSGFCDAYDYVNVVAVDGSTVTLSAPTKFAHPTVDVPAMVDYTTGQSIPARTYGAEVLNLTRNVKMGGTATGRSHVMNMGMVDISSIEISYTGPRQSTGPVLGRHGLHFHERMDMSRGTVVDSVVVRDSGSHAFVSHMSNGITLLNCISHNTQEDAYWWDTRTDTRSVGPESYDITYQSCVASRVNHYPTYRAYRLTGFNLLGGTGNRLLDCVAVGINGSKNSSGVQWPEMGAGQEVNSGLWENNGIVSHNNSHQGIFTWQNTSYHHVVKNFVCYRNGVGGVEHGAYVNSYHYINGALIENGSCGFKMDAVSNGSLELDGMLTVGEKPVSTGKHTLAANNATKIDKLIARGYTGALVNLDYPHDNGDSPIDLIDIYDPDGVPGQPYVAINPATTPGSVVRVIINGQVVETHTV